jgi:hypothetical protein
MEMLMMRSYLYREALGGAKRHPPRGTRESFPSSQSRGNAGKVGMKKTPPFNIHLQPDTRAALERAAKGDMWSVSSLIEEILVEWLRAQGYLPGDTASSIKVEDLTAENDE